MTANGNTLAVAKEAGFNYVAAYSAGSNQLGLAFFSVETMPTAGTANYTGLATYVLTQGGSATIHALQPATMTANFAPLTGNMDIDVTGDNTIAMSNLAVGLFLISFGAQSSTTASVAGAGITDVSGMSVVGAGVFAGPTAQEAAGLFTLTNSAGTEIDMLIIAKQ